MATDDLREVAELALYEHQEECKYRDLDICCSDAVLAAITPLIREQALAEAEDAVLTVDALFVYGTKVRLDAVAAIRGLRTAEEQPDA